MHLQWVIIFCWHLEGRRRKEQDPDPLVSEVPYRTDPRIWISTKIMSRIRNTLVHSRLVVSFFKVNTESRKFHTTPFTLLPVMVTLNRWQGTSALFKGERRLLWIGALTFSFFSEANFFIHCTVPTYGTYHCCRSGSVGTVFFWPTRSRSGSVSQRYGFGTFYHQAK